MKTMFATIALVTLTICPARAEETYRSTMTGNVTIEVVPKDAKATKTTETPAKPGETLAIRFVPPPKPSTRPDEDDIVATLAYCGKEWNRKLDAYLKGETQREKYSAYYKRWEWFPAQRPPKLGGLLTRTTYRTCMYACLQNRLADCPGGWAPEAGEKGEAKTEVKE